MSQLIHGSVLRVAALDRGVEVDVALGRELGVDLGVDDLGDRRLAVEEEEVRVRVVVAGEAEADVGVEHLGEAELDVPAERERRHRVALERLVEQAAVELRVRGRELAQHAGCSSRAPCRSSYGVVSTSPTVLTHSGLAATFGPKSMCSAERVDDDRRRRRERALQLEVDLLDVAGDDHQAAVDLGRDRVRDRGLGLDQPAAGAVVGDRDRAEQDHAERDLVDVEAEGAERRRVGRRAEDEVVRRARRLAEQLGRHAREDVERRAAVGLERGRPEDLQRAGRRCRRSGRRRSRRSWCPPELPVDRALVEHEVGLLGRALDLGLGRGELERDRLLVAALLALPLERRLGGGERVDLDAVDAEVAASSCRRWCARRPCRW